MASTVTTLPAARIEALSGLYRSAKAGRRRRGMATLAVVAALVWLSAWMAEVRPGTFFGNIGNLADYLAAIVPPLTLGDLPADLRAWYWNLPKWLALLGETLLIAYLGTIAGAVGAFGLCFVASAKLVRSRPLRFGATRLLEFCRTVPDIVFALIFVLAFGLGPIVGVMAIAIHTVGALGKLFAEIVDNIDTKPVEGLTASGASWVETIRFAVLPQVLAGFASYTLLRFEINVRSAGVMGFVGAGGIGMEFLVAIRSFYYSDISAILLLIVATVVIIDMATERLRHRLSGLRDIH